MNAIFVAVVNGFIPGVLLAAVVWLVLRLTRGVLNAATRYGVWWAVLAIVAILPAFYLPRSPRAAPVPVAVSASTLRPEFHSMPTGSANVPLRPVALPQRPAITPIPIHETRWPQMLAELWAAAALLMLGRLILSLIMLNFRRRKAIDAPPSLKALMRQSLDRCGVKRKARIAIVNKGASPMVCGPFHPSVLIPDRLLSSLSAAELEQICLHEAAHLARFDDCVLLLQRLVEALFALHPAIRWIGRQIDLEREIACDDFVIAATGGTRAYASCLTHVAELANGFAGSPVAAAAAEESSHLHQRIDMLLSRTRRGGTTILKMRLLASFAALALLTWLAARSPSFLALAAPAQQPAAPHSPAIPAPESTPSRPPKVVATLAARAMRIPVTVTDPLNRYVTGLGKSSFRLFEDGVEQAVQSLDEADSNTSFAVVSNSDGELKALDQSIARTEQKLAELRNTYKDAHPEIEILKARLQQLNKERNSSTAALEARLERIQQKMAKLQNDRVDLETKLSFLKTELSMLDHMPVSTVGAITNPQPVTRTQIEVGIAKTKALLIYNQNDLDAHRKDIEWLNQELGSMTERQVRGTPSPLLSQLTAAIDAAPANKTERAIVTEFDMRDNSVLGSENELHALIQRSPVPIYAIAVQPAGATAQGESTAFLNLLTDATGGREFKAAAWSEVPEIQRKIAIEIQNEYTVTYIPKNRAENGAYRHVEVRMVPTRGLPVLQAHTIPGYYATSQ